ncbi:hypothetical protein ACFT8V_22495 [Streptomyces griseoincarnatus]
MAIIAAIGTLLFTGIATYYSAEIAQEQLNQSREDAEVDRQSQATRVSFWEQLDGVTSESSDSYELHIMNRSPDPIPIYFVVIEMQVMLPDGVNSKSVLVQFENRSLPPCTELIMTGRHMQYHETSSGKWVKMRGIGRVLMSFMDRNSEEWQRSEGKLSQGDELSTAFMEGITDGYPGRVTGPVLEKTAPACGAQPEN